MLRLCRRTVIPDCALLCAPLFQIKVILGQKAFPVNPLPLNYYLALPPQQLGKCAARVCRVWRSSPGRPPGPLTRGGVSIHLPPGVSHLYVKAQIIAVASSGLLRAHCRAVRGN